MKKLNICIDIDGTITEPYYWLDITNKFFKKNIEEKDITSYYIHKVLGVNKEEYDDFYEKNKFNIHSKQKLREDAVDIIQNLKQNHKIFFITARDTSLTMLTHSYLKKNKVPFNDVFVLGTHYKADKAKELNCNIFIEDSYDNAIHLSEHGFKVLLIDTNYNKNPVNDNITRVYHWKEIYEFININSLQSEAI